MDNYFSKMDTIIHKILNRNEHYKFNYDILNTQKNDEIKLIVLKEKHKQMKIGEIWEETIGNYNDFIKLKIGNETGLDIISKSRKIIIELKNRTNTDNHSSRKANMDKLVKYKKENPDYTCIYGLINDKTEELTLKGSHKKIIIDDVEIEIQTGYLFLRNIFGDNLELILEFLKITIDKY